MKRNKNGTGFTKTGEDVFRPAVSGDGEKNRKEACQVKRHFLLPGGCFLRKRKRPGGLSAGE